MRDMKAALEDERILRESRQRGKLPCDERHYTRFLRQVPPGPELDKGDLVCDECGQYFWKDKVEMVPHA